MVSRLERDRAAALAASIESQARAKLANSAPVNYDPTDPDKMRLPVNVTCGDCIHIRRCTLMFGHTVTDAYCDWSPSRFKAAAKATGDTQ